MSDLDVARALAPLYREYLRRLDEMASRLPAEALLREATTRGPDGSLAAGPGGFTLVFDVADLRTQETFEVRGATPDAPTAAGGQVGHLQIELLPGNWEALPIACRFDVPPSDAEVVALADLIRAWALVAAQGGFARAAPPEPRPPASGRLHSLRLSVKEKTTTATVDLGTCPPEALAVLLSALDGYGRDAFPLARVTLGGPPEDD